ncbi:MAG: glycosyltransferase family 2 protein [Acidithiobacillus sp.]
MVEQALLPLFILISKRWRLPLAHMESEHILLKNEKTQENEFYRISVVIPCYNESANISSLFDRTRAVLQKLEQRWEIIFVNDGSSDDTLLRLLALRDRDDRVMIINLSRNFGKEAALSAGLDHATGDVAIPLDADLQDPPELIQPLFTKFLEGYDVVNAVRQRRSGESYAKRMSSFLFYRVLNRVSSIEIPHDAGDCRLLSRKVLEALKRLPERRRYMKGLFAWTGFKTTSIYFQRDARQNGRSSWNYWRLWQLALEGITSFSHVPLQFASYMGITIAFTSFLYAIYMIIETICCGNSVKGYPSLMVTILFLGGVQLIALGVLGEYISRIYEESKQRPLYLIQDLWINNPDNERKN